MIKQIKYFQAVVRCESFSEAAQDALFRNRQSLNKFKRWKRKWALNFCTGSAENFRLHQPEKFFTGKVW